MRYIYFLIIPLFFTACFDKPKTYNGYLDASLVYLSSEYGGKLSELNASKGDVVAKNCYMFALERTTENLSVKMSNDGVKELFAQKKEIENKMNYAKTNLQRIEKISKDDGASKDDVDSAKLTLANLNEELKSIDYKIKQQLNDSAQKEWKMNQKEVFSPDIGVVFDTYFSKGEFVVSGAPVMSLVVAKNVKATFFISETELSKIALGQKIKLTFDGTQEILDAKISYISNIAEYTPPIIFSKDEKQKLVFKVEAKPNDVNLTKLHIGQPVLISLQ